MKSFFKILFLSLAVFFLNISDTFSIASHVDSYDVNESPLSDRDAITHGKIGAEQTVSGDIRTNVKAGFEIPEIPGMRYAWRVRAMAKDGLEDANVFRNEGYSEVFYFDYAADCEAVRQSTVLIEKTTARITWMPTKASEYLLEYRKKGSVKWRDTPIVYNGTEYPLVGLEYGQTYEYRIGTRCVSNDSFDFCEAKAFVMPAQPDRNPECGMLPEADLSNQKPLEELLPGLPIFAGDFPVFVSSVSGANGRFSGTGYVGLPFAGAKVAVVFDNIFINSDYKLVEGIIEVKYDPNGKSMLVDIDQTLTGGKGVGDIRSGEEKAKFSVGYNINPNAPIEIKPTTWKNVPDEIKNTMGYTPSGGENAPAYIITFEDEEGKKHDIVVDSLPATVEDKDGDIFVVSEDGKLTEAVTASDLKLDPSEKDKPDSSIATIAFESTPKTRYALDIYRDIYAKVPEYFLKYKPSGEDMIASAKFIAAGQSDEIFVRVTGTKADFDPKKVHFLTGNDREYKGIYDDREKGWTVNLIGGQAGDGQEIYVVYEKEKGKPVTLSKIRAYAYEPKSILVKLIPVNGFTNGFTKEAVSQGLNAIYNKVAVNCNVEIANSFDYEPLKGKAFDVTGSGLFSTLTGDMKALNNAYKQARPDETGICLFIIENVTGSEGVTGDMPRGKQFGYLFSGADVRTIAHEIGHGVFQLEHPFDRALRGEFEKGQLEHCLMDYGSGTEFCKLEWDAINAPGLVIGLFEKDDDAMALANCNAPKPTKKGTKESEKIETSGLMQYGIGINREVIDCKKVWYYHIKETPGWYETEKYAEIIQPVIKGLILAQTDDIILELNENELYDIQQLKLNYLATFRDFYADENLDEDSFGTLLTDEIVSKAYAGLRKEINDIYLKRSGKLESVSPEFELLSWGLGAVIKQISLKVAKVTIKGLSTSAFYATVRNALGKAGITRQNWNGFANIFKATADEIAEAAAKIKDHRIAQNAGMQGNYGYLEGKIGNITKNGELVRSGASDKIDEIFEAIPVNNQNIAYGENAWMRTTDSEYKMLNRLANDLKVKKGKVYIDITGELKIVSERPYCQSCSGIIQQFNNMFPNVKLIVIDGAK